MQQKLKDEARLITRENMFEKLDSRLKHAKNRRQLPVRWKGLIAAWEHADKHWVIPGTLMCKNGYCVKYFHCLNDLGSFARYSCSGHLIDAGDNYIGVAQNLKVLLQTICALTADV